MRTTLAGERIRKDMWGKRLPQRLRKQGLAAPVLYEPERAFGD